MTPTGIVVGFDGSPDAEQAVAWAAREARARHCPLTVCFAAEHADEASPAVPAEPGRLRPGQDVVARGLRLARDVLCSDQVSPLLEAGSPAAVLCGRAAGAEMTVLGFRGREGLPGLPLGSVSLKVAAHAPGRVVVVRGHWRPVPGQHPWPIVVGCDGSSGSLAAVEFAFEEAALRDACVVAVCALADSPGLLGGARQIRTDFEEIMSAQESDHPEVTVSKQVCEGSARSALLRAARDAQLLVLGARGRGGLPGMPLGSASVALLSHAACPVAIAHADD
ncbi:MAG TPA: universal stress protein [Streptosporangiaceae bacterium]|nr:universal stress protein [Streptosporangiaceae bacterium]